MEEAQQGRSGKLYRPKVAGAEVPFAVHPAASLRPEPTSGSGSPAPSWALGSSGKVGGSLEPGSRLVVPPTPLTSPPRDTVPIFPYAGTISPDWSEHRMERAPLLLVFGDLAERVAGLLRVRPGLIPRLVVAPREVIHSVGAYLYLAPEATQPDELVAAVIDDSHARDLLRAAMPDYPPRLYRALDRAGDRIREKRFFERLGALCAGPFAVALLAADELAGVVGELVSIRSAAIEWSSTRQTRQHATVSLYQKTPVKPRDATMRQQFY